MAKKHVLTITVFPSYALPRDNLLLSMPATCNDDEPPPLVPDVLCAVSVDWCRNDVPVECGEAATGLT